MINTKHFGEYVANFFAEQDCELLEPYKNCMTPISYRCSCGTISKVRWNDFKDGTRCNTCKGKRLAETREKNQSHWSVTGVYRPPTNQVELTCQQCGEKYSVPKHKEKTSKFCDKKCQDKWKETHTIPPELTPEVIAKMVATKKANGSVKGENNPNWNPDREYIKLIKQVRERSHAHLQHCYNMLGTKKENHSFQILGYTPNDLLSHLTNHPKWAIIKDENWHIDHIFPIKAFMDHDVHDIKIINCLENLQPLAGKDNLTKSDKYDKSHFLEWLLLKQSS